MLQPAQTPIEGIAQDGRMLPFARIPDADLVRVAVVLTDVDDTLTTDGRLPADAYAALEKPRAAGLIVIPVTGRPAGRRDLIARLWPVDGVVGENGAFYFRCQPGHGMTRVHMKPEGERRRDRDQLTDLGKSILAAINRIVASFATAGATAEVSSIHVNGWCGAYDKLGMTRRLLTEEFGLDLDRDNARIVFVGDSPNDAPMFGFFRGSVAVANFRDFAARGAA